MKLKITIIEETSEDPLQMDIDLDESATIGELKQKIMDMTSFNKHALNIIEP